MDTIDETDHRCCRTCRQYVALGEKCFCEIVRENHLREIREHRNLMGSAVPLAPYRSTMEQGLPDSDTQDMPVPMPSLRIGWRTTMLVCAALLALAVLFVGAMDGQTRWRGAQVRAWRTEEAHRIEEAGQ